MHSRARILSQGPTRSPEPQVGTPGFKYRPKSDQLASTSFINPERAQLRTSCVVI